jgi:CRP-like cAMP-binding protein
LKNLCGIDHFKSDQIGEAIFGVVTVCIGVFINATLLAKILEVWTAANKAETDFEARINTVMAFLRFNGIVGKLRDDILDYFEFRHSNQHGANDQKIFLCSLPTEMQARVIYRIFPNALNSSYIFTGANESFVAQCVLKMSCNSMLTMPGQVIAAQGTLGAEMYLLKSGSCDVSVTDLRGASTRVEGIVSGQCFGEISLWFDCKRSATVTSADYSQLFTLTRTDLDEVLQRFPEMNVSLSTYAIASCLRVPSMAPALAGISCLTSEKLARRMSFSRHVVPRLFCRLLV